MKHFLERVADRFGFALIRKTEPPVAHPDLDPDFFALHARCKPYTLTSVERVYALRQAVTYISRHGIEGDLVECGVWRGGSMMAAALTLLALGDTRRTLWLYDTYEGMSEPTERDINRGNRAARRRWERSQKDGHNAWNYAPLEDVRQNLLSTGYPEANLRFVKGKVEDTIPGAIPERIAILRLDTDFYESTYHELTHLYPLLVSRGVLLLDDYGHWRGARDAVDRYVAEHNPAILLDRVDYSGRIAVKP
ncbi:MAG TPA: TylF/MycF/NovP-related O-methyltransferase [Gemmatimonadaceae bacterium]|nr:TylF/MycF/NovP-related O-methyltransferase [Gemmatimonadaceae bacterium]